MRKVTLFLIHLYLNWCKSKNKLMFSDKNKKLKKKTMKKSSFYLSNGKLILSFQHDNIIL